MTHTPTPWAVEVVADHMARIVTNDTIVVMLDRQSDGSAPFRERAATDAYFIVRACNSHEALVEALKLAGQYLVDSGVEHQAAVGRTQVLPAILAALKLAEQS